MSEPLLPIDARRFRQLERGDPYWRGRWEYLFPVAKLIRRLQPRSVLEIGPGPERFVPGSDTLDIDETVEPTYRHDAGVAPWPCVPGSYDLVVGLQCWEHFNGRQHIAFAEALRAASPAGHVLISVPYLWTKTNAEHRGIGTARIRQWTLGRNPIRRVLVRTPATRKRLILLFSGKDFLANQEEETNVTTNG